MRAVPIEFPGLGRFTREWLEEHAERAQSLMAECKGRYPLCLCREPGLPLYIAQRTRYYLARLPNSGPKHAPFCPSYEPDRELCGWGIYSHVALTDGGDGRINVKLGVPLLIRGPGASGTHLVTPQAAPERLYRDTIELRGLLHLLWERAEFNRWTPRMRGRRHYRQVHKYLLEAAETIGVRRQPLTRHLYIPEPFVPNQALEIESRRQRAFRELGQTASGLPLRILVCGRVRSIAQSEHGGGLRLAHLPNEFVIWAAEDVLARLRHATEFAWIDWPSLHPEFQLMVLLTMHRSRGGHWRVDDLAGMITTEDFIPVLSLEEALLAKRLVAEERAFYKPLPYDAPPFRFPNFLLTDGAEVAVPLEIIGNDADAAARHQRIAQYREERRPFWLWNTEESALPPLLWQPGACSQDTREAREAPGPLIERPRI